MKRTIRLTFCFALALAPLPGCGAGVGQDPPSTPSPSNVPNPMQTILPAPSLTKELPPAQPPPPVISVVPPQNSATAAVETTAGAQRTATAQQNEVLITQIAATESARATALALRAPTMTAYALTGDLPESPRAELGRPYPFLLHTHCGVDWATDFDGSFWDAADKNYRPRGLGDPAQRGTMTLTGDNSARFDYEGGSILFVRHVGPKYIRPCY